jgi:hypothetical protein
MVTPKLWIKQAVHYFELYHVESVVWVQAATMHFQGAAKRWLSSVEDQLESTTWADFCAQLLSRFAWDEHGGSAGIPTAVPHTLSLLKRRLNHCGCPRQFELFHSISNSRLIYMKDGQQSLA